DLDHPDPWRPERLALVFTANGCASVGWAYFVRRHYAGSTGVWPLLAGNGLQVWLAAFCPGMVIALAALGAQESRAWGGFRWLMARAWLGFPLAALLWAAAYAIEHYSTLRLIVLSRAVYFIACGLILGCGLVAQAPQPARRRGCSGQCGSPLAAGWPRPISSDRT